MREIIIALIVALAVVAIGWMVYLSSENANNRKTEVTLACIEKSRGNAEAVLCRQKPRGE